MRNQILIQIIFPISSLPESEPDEIILISFENNSHYNLLNVKGKNLETKISNKAYNAIINKNFEIKPNIFPKKIKYNLKMMKIKPV